MSDFESRLTDALSSGAEGAPDVSGLADGARRRSRQRRRTMRVAAAAALAVVAVPVGVIALNDGGSDGNVAEDVPTTPSDTRIETWHDLQIEVPASWGYGGRTAYCTGGKAETPVVERPGGVVALIMCDPANSFGVSWGDGTTMMTPAYPSGHVWQYEAGDYAEYKPGSWLGYWYEGDDFVQVNAGDKATVEEIIDSVQRVDSVDDNGCPVTRQEGFTSDSEQMSVCRYDAGGQLEQSERLSADDTASAVAALNEAPAGNPEIPASCAQDQLPRLVVDLITADLNSEVIIQAPCPYSPGITSGGESFQELTADVLYWALSPGWSGSVEQGVPLPGKLRELHRYASTDALTEGGVCPEQVPGDNSSTALPEGPTVVCHLDLSWQAESGGTFLLTDERELSDEDEVAVESAIAGAPDQGGVLQGTCRGGPGELFIVLSQKQSTWVYNSRCAGSGIDMQVSDGSIAAVTQEVLDALGSSYGLLR